jgi:drug/metabolite transporter (DMT)-like permease
MQTIVFTLLALFAFAANSVLCRLALTDNAIDPSSFTITRLLSGAIVLAILVYLTPSKESSQTKGSWAGGFALFIYAASFSYAYVSLETGIGALILFSCVQIMMIVTAVLSGDKLSHLEWMGAGIAFSGFVYLIFPGLTAPSVSGLIMMSISGVAWASYTLLGMRSTNPLRDTAFNFLRTLPFLLILLILSLKNISLSQTGILLAVVSGAVTSGVGYAVWYVALRQLSTVQAAIVQLFVPVLATLSGVIFVNESLSLRLILASVMILGGIFAVTASKHSKRK